MKAIFREYFSSLREDSGKVFKLIGNLRFKTTVNGYGWTSTRDLG